MIHPPIRSTTQIWVLRDYRTDSGVISRGNQQRRREMSAVFLGYFLRVPTSPFLTPAFERLACHAGRCVTRQNKVRQKEAPHYFLNCNSEFFSCRFHSQKSLSCIAILSFVRHFAGKLEVAKGKCRLFSQAAIPKDAANVPVFPFRFLRLSIARPVTQASAWRTSQNDASGDGFYLLE